MIKHLDPVYLLSHPSRKRDVLLWMQDHGIHPNHVPMDGSVEFLDEGRVEVELMYNHERKFVVVDGTYPFPMDVLM